MKKIYSVIILGLLLSTRSFGQERKLEVLRGLTIDEKGISFVVTSTGCTDKGDFTVDSEITAINMTTMEYEISLYRDKPDFCRMISHPVTIKFSYAEMNVSQVTRKQGLLKVTNHTAVPRVRSKTYRGFNIDGEFTSCVAPSRPQICTREYTPNEEFAAECSKAGYKVYTCGCHYYLCSGKIER